MSSDDAWPHGWQLPDQDGDGHSDVFVVDPGRRGLAQVVSGSTGRLIWSTTTTALLYDFTLMDAGIVTRSKARGRLVHDIALASSLPATLHPAVATVAASETTNLSNGHVELLTGGTGAPVWSRTGDVAYPLVGTGRVLVGRFSSTVTQGVRAQVDLEGVDVAGVTAWRSSVVLEGGANDNQAGGALLEAGDVTGDGVPDTEVQLGVGSDAASRASTTYVSGRDGRTVRRDGTWSLFFSLDGHGDDLIRGNLVLDAMSGRSLLTLPGAPEGYGPVAVGGTARQPPRLAMVARERVWLVEASGRVAWSSLAAAG